MVRQQKPRLVRQDDLPPESISVARKRTAAHLQSMQLVGFNLQTLLINVYLQGVRDSFETMLDRGMLNHSEFRKPCPEEGLL